MLTAALFFWIGVAMFGIYFWEYDEPESLTSFLYFLSTCALFIIVSYRERQLEKKRLYDNDLLSVNTFSAQPDKENEQLLLISDKDFLRLSTFTFYAILILLIFSVGFLLYHYINGDIDYGILVVVYLELFSMYSIHKSIKQIKQCIYDREIS
ncbi:hypothetical protein ACTXGJ_05795 [Psychrobacter sp. 1Y11]|uniref:hypothetical protein n=2 Tax=Psychrobacter TaxID=497 RepID=UPI003FD267B0